jgi:deoxyribodipyrimidine photo-lyase
MTGPNGSMNDVAKTGDGAREAISIFWFRRDLRLEDNVGLHHALKSALPVVPIFIFDRNILDGLEYRTDRRIEFIHAACHGPQKGHRS